MRVQKSLQPSAVRPGAFQPGLNQRAERSRPGQQLAVARRGRGELAFVEQFSSVGV